MREKEEGCLGVCSCVSAVRVFVGVWDVLCAPLNQLPLFFMCCGLFIVLSFFPSVVLLGRGDDDTGAVHPEQSTTDPRQGRPLQQALPHVPGAVLSARPEPQVSGSAKRCCVGTIVTDYHSSVCSVAFQSKGSKLLVKAAWPRSTVGACMYYKGYRLCVFLLP